MEIRLRPAGVPDGARWRRLRWFFGWARVIAHARKFQRRRRLDAAASLRLITVALTVLGFVCGALTPGDLRITPLTVQWLVVLAIWTFAFVGYWMMGWPEERTKALSWVFAVAGATGSVIYVAAQYANLAIEGSDLPLGMAAGWFADLLFLPAIAILLPPFLVLIAAGGWQGIARYKIVVALGWLAAGLLFCGMLLEPHLFTHPAVQTPLSNSGPASLWKELTYGGLGLLAMSVTLGLFAIRYRPARQGDEAVVRWYAYGGVLGIVAFIPYLLVFVAPPKFFPSAPTFVRAWGSLIVALVAIAAIPATAGERLPSTHIRRLIRGAIIAAIATGLHEYMVIKTVDQVLAKQDPQIGGQIFLTYAAIVLIAILLEPVARMFDWTTERFFTKRSPPDDLIDEAFEDFRGSRKHLHAAITRALGWDRDHPTDPGNFLQRVLLLGSTAAKAPEPDRAAGQDLNTILVEMRSESRRTHDLVDLIEAEKAQASASDPTHRTKANIKP